MNRSTPTPPRSSLLSRRAWTVGAAASVAAAAGLVGGQRSAGAAETSADAASESSRGRFPICAFTKPFNSLSFEEMAQRLAAIGFDGVEATVRRGGNVEPEDVQEQLPRLCDALAKAGLRLTVMTTDINADDALARRVLETAAELGVKRFRMGYVRYDDTTPIAQQHDRWKKQFAGLAKRCERLGVTGLYQNHAGARYMGAPVWDLDRVLADISADHIGVAFDIRHATVENGTSWPITWRMIQPRVRVVYVKDFTWKGDRTVNVPLGEGLVGPAFFEQLVQSDFAGPISLHEEYLDHTDASLVDRHLDALAADLKTLQAWLD